MLHNPSQGVAMSSNQYLLIVFNLKEHKISLYIHTSKVDIILYNNISTHKIYNFVISNLLVEQWHHSNKEEFCRWWVLRIQTLETHLSMARLCTYNQSIYRIYDITWSFPINTFTFIKQFSIISIIVLPWIIDNDIIIRVN